MPNNAEVTDESDEGSFQAHVKRMARQPDYVNGLVDSCARMLGDLLSIKNAEINDGKLTLGKCLYNLKDLFPSRQTLDLIEKLSWALDFCRGCLILCQLITVKCEKSDLVALRDVSKYDAYYTIETFYRTRGSRRSSMKVGGIGAKVSAEIEKSARTWLEECDRVMCSSFGDHEEDEDSTEVADLIRNLAVAIADSLSSMDGLLPQHRRLNARMLEARAAEEFARVCSSAEEDKRTDLVVLKTFEYVATYGVKGEGGRSVIERLSAHLLQLVHFPPRELTNNNGHGLNLELLGNALGEDVDLDVRVGLINHWRQMHGAYAATAATNAIAKIEKWSLDNQPAFVGVLCSQAGRPSSAGMRMPPVPFALTSVLYFKPRGSGGDARGLDYSGRRIVRLTSLVWELIGRGELVAGEVSSRLVAPLVAQGVIETRVVAAVITQKLESISIGETLRKFTEDVSDGSSHLSDEVGCAMAHLGKFSELSISAAFHHKSPVLPLLKDELTERARRELLFDMPRHYFDFAVDALAIALPILKQRRASIGVSPWRASGAIADLLRTVPAVCEWSPLKGNLQLHSADFRRASPLVQPLLKKMATDDSTLVAYKRPYGGGAASKSRMAYVFDTRALLRVLAVK